MLLWLRGIRLNGEEGVLKKCSFGNSYECEKCENSQ